MRAKGMQQPHAARRVAEKSTKVGTFLECVRYIGETLRRRRRAKRARRGVNGICARFIPGRFKIFLTYVSKMLTDRKFRCEALQKQYSGIRDR
jgi:hypothetical protein